MNKLLPRERVIEALSLREPDRVPWVELEIEQIVVDRVLGKSHVPVDKPLGLYNRNVEEEKAFSRLLGKDNILYSFRPPIFCDFMEGEDGVLFYGHGHIRTKEDLKKMIFPDPEDKSFFKPAEEFVKNKAEFAAMATTRLGFAATYLSMGMAEFFMALNMDMEFVLEVMDRYTRWASRVMEIVSNIGFDFVSASDDMAYKTGPMINPKMLKDIFIPKMREVADSITIPWMTHSDGNMTTIIDEWLKLGQNGIHPIEPGAMDICQIKADYGSKVCLVGNIDVDLISAGKPEQIEDVIRHLIKNIAPGGGYILSSGNSLPSYASIDNVFAISDALKKYGNYKK